MKKLTLLLALLILSINYVKARKIVYSNLHETTEQKNEHKYSGSWNSLNDSLTIDTLFKGVKKIVFSGHINNKILVRGSKRETVALNFDYNLKVKGVYAKKNRRCKLSYTLKDSVLTVDLERKNYVFIGMSYVKETTRMVFEVPENIAVTINASYGDVEVNNLSNNNYHIKTTSGDIKTERVNGNIDLSCSYGDISLKQISGKIDAKTISGDIITERVNGNIDLSCSYGDISLKQISGKIDAKTISGDVKTERVNGNIYLSCSYGDISLKQISGNIDAKTTSGDITGNNINVVDALNIVCSSGDVDCELTNPTPELMFNLYTLSGKIKVRRQDLSYKGFGDYAFGQGKVKITAESTSGNIIFR
jgi:DUF4097 and DUF4098 domain-containing protein YvlB